MTTFKTPVILSVELSNNYNLTGFIGALAYKNELSASEIKGLDGEFSSLSSSLTVDVEAHDKEGFAKSYVIKQGGLSVNTTIDIPVDTPQVFLTAIDSDTISIDISENKYISAIVRDGSIDSNHLASNLSGYISSIRDDVDSISVNYFNLSEEETVLCSTTFDGDVRAYFNNIIDRVESRISDIVVVENNFGSMYNGIANIINACNLNIDFNLAYPVVSAFNTINKIGKEEKLSVTVDELDLNTATVKNGFDVLSQIIVSSDYKINRNLGEELKKIDKRFDVIEKSIATMNNHLTLIEEFFKNNTIVVK